MNAVVDNDIVYKAACYAISSHVLGSVNQQGSAHVGVLAAARFVVGKKINRAKLNGGPHPALEQLSFFMSCAEQLETTNEEQDLAATIELAAQRIGAALDSGESQLCSVAITRVVPIMLTGDKRAIRALELLLKTEQALKSICGKVRCFEQFLIGVLEELEHETLRKLICGEPTVDRTATICFACKSPTVTADAVLQGLNSYIEDLRKEASCVLES